MLCAARCWRSSRRASSPQACASAARVACRPSTAAGAKWTRRSCDARRVQPADVLRPERGAPRRIGVLGLGAVGGRVVRQLAATDGIDEIVVSDPIRCRWAASSPRWPVGAWWDARAGCSPTTSTPSCSPGPPAITWTSPQSTWRPDVGWSAPATPSRTFGACSACTPWPWSAAPAWWSAPPSLPVSAACSPVRPDGTSSGSPRSTWPAWAPAVLHAQVSSMRRCRVATSTGATGRGWNARAGPAGSCAGSPDTSVPRTATGPSWRTRCCSSPGSQAWSG
jgi:hypothetical protein